jgi:hypothetical protein
MSNWKRERPYVIDTIFPQHALHLISGGSGTWKTSLLFTLIQRWQAGEDVFGYKSYPSPWFYVSYDRHVIEAWDCLEDIDFKPPEQLIQSGMDNPQKFQPNSSGIIDIMEKQLPQGGLLCIDGFQFIQDYSDKNTPAHQSVWRFVARLMQAARKHNVTILGVAYSPKMKKDEGTFMNPRERVMGTMAWGATCGTIIGMDTMDADSKLLSLLPRRTKESAYKVTRDDRGKLIFADAEEARIEGATGFIAFQMWINDMSDDEIFTRQDALHWGAENSSTDRTVERYIKKAIEESLITPSKRGEYRRVPTGQTIQ